MKYHRIESVCIFGSVARASTDSLSDRDVLVICDDSQRTAQLAAEWREMHWSVSAYTSSRFLRMVDAGSLFVQHLKHEGIILADENGWLSGCLQRAKPKSSYLDDAISSVFLARPIERFEADAQLENNLIAADLGYVSIRNFGICYLADKGRLTFDYSKIISNISKDFNLDGKETRLLESLRLGKVAYRKRFDGFRLKGSIGQLRSVLSKYFVSTPLGQIELNQPTRFLGGGYTMLRDFEASIVSQLGRCPSKSELEVQGLSEVWRWVRNPRSYSWSIRNASRDELNGLIRTIVTPSESNLFSRSPNFQSPLAAPQRAIIRI